MKSLNPKANLTAVPRGKSSPGIPFISNTRSSPTLASTVPDGGGFIERDLAYIRSLGPGPMPWEVTSSAENPSLR